MSEKLKQAGLPWPLTPGSCWVCCVRSNVINILQCMHAASSAAPSPHPSAFFPLPERNVPGPPLQALTAPSGVASAITCEVYKKYVLVSLLHAGTVAPLPKFASHRVRQVRRVEASAPALQ